MNARGRLLALLVLVPAAALAACGAEPPVTGNATDRAFAKVMAEHHRTAIDAAREALVESERPRVRAVANRIIRSQSAEVRTLERIERELAEAGVPAGDLEQTDEEMGMTRPAGDAGHRGGFDQRFLAMMVPHHMGAIRMAQREQAEGAHAELVRLARTVIAAQSREGAQLHRWSHEWFRGAGLHAD